MDTKNNNAEKKLKKEPEGELAIRTLAMPGDTNPDGDIFGGWVLSHMDLAGVSVARQYTPHRTVTVAIQSMEFIAPVRVGDFICCYASVVRIGRTSITIKIETWAIGPTERIERRQVTEGVFTYVAIDKNGCPTPIERREK